MSGRIVIGFDGSDSGEDALALGLVLCRATGQAPVVAAVYPEEYPIGPGRVDAEWVKYLRDEAEAMLARARRVLGEDGADYRALSSASAARGLHELAEEEAAALVVVGSGRRGAFGRLYPGSTGERLLQGASCPVAVAPRGLRERDLAGLSTIAVAFVDTPEGHAALDFGVELARRSGARLRALSVTPAGAEIVPPVIGRDAEEAFMRTARETFAGALQEALASVPDDIETSSELLEGDVVDVLAGLDQRDADLLVCGSRAYGPVRRILLGGVSSGLLRRAATPVVVVPRRAEDTGPRRTAGREPVNTPSP